MRAVAELVLTKVQLKDGSRVDVSVTISPVRNAAGKIVGASKIARDITARKRWAEAARFLAEASRALAELLDVPSTLQKVARLAQKYKNLYTWDVTDAGQINYLARELAA